MAHPVPIFTKLAKILNSTTCTYVIPNFTLNGTIMWKIRAEIH
jgi:hypothetical protein